jgi:hypothetical protein
MQPESNDVNRQGHPHTGAATLKKLTGVWPRLTQVRAVGGVIEKPDSSSKTILASSAAAILPPVARSPSLSR